MKQDLQTQIDSVKKERAAYPEHNTLHLENFTNITVNSYSITPQKRQNGIEEDCHISFDENGENKRIIARETI